MSIDSVELSRRSRTGVVEGTSGSTARRLARGSVGGCCSASGVVVLGIVGTGLPSRVAGGVLVGAGHQVFAPVFPIPLVNLGDQGLVTVV